MKTIQSNNKQNNLLKGKAFVAQREQKGAVMITVLMLLVLVTLMGLSSMKQGMFQARLGAAEVSYTTCFMSAESALNAVFRGFQEQVRLGIPIDDLNNFINQASGGQVKHCLGGEGLVSRTGSTCPNDSLSAYSGLQVAIVSRAPMEDDPSERANLDTFGNDINRGGNLLVYTVARCELPGIDMGVSNKQAWKHETKNSLLKNDDTNS